MERKLEMISKSREDNEVSYLEKVERKAILRR